MVNSQKSGNTIGVKAPSSRRGRLLFRIVLGVAALIFLAIGIGYLASAAVQRLDAFAVDDWAETAGVMQSAEVIDRYGHRPSGRDARRTRYEARVRYEYTVDGVTFTGDRLAIRPVRRGSHDDADRQLGGYRAGQRVSVRYDPANPADSILRTDLSWFSTFKDAVFGLGYFLAGSATAGFAIKLPRSSPRDSPPSTKPGVSPDKPAPAP